MSYKFGIRFSIKYTNSEKAIPNLHCNDKKLPKNRLS
jgi:hypothetical protein